MKAIRLTGACQHNLKGLNLEIPWYQVTVISGPSGSGKSTLALDTLYAEGQRRYVETFSAYVRQFLERLPRPQVETIEGIPPAIAIEQVNPIKSSRSTVGTLSEINHFVKLLYFREAVLLCPSCGRPVEKTSPEEAARWLLKHRSGQKAIITTKVSVSQDFVLLKKGLLSAGYFRAYTGGEIREISEIPEAQEIEVLIDRLILRPEDRSRLVQALEEAYRVGSGQANIHLPYEELRFNNKRHCPYCNLDFPPPSPNLFSFNSPAGACPQCRGFGRIIDIDWDLVIPDRRKSLLEGAIVLLETPSAWEDREELFDWCQENGIPLDRPFEELPEEIQKKIIYGDGSWYGLKGIFDWLEKKRYKAHVRIFLARYRAYLTCPACKGSRFRREALWYRLRGQTIGQFYAQSIAEALNFMEDLNDEGLDTATRTLAEEIRRRLRYLHEVGLSYLRLDRPSRTLSGGEVARVLLTQALASDLVETLYVLDEPSRGLHAQDTHRVVDLIRKLAASGNTTVVIEHDPAIIASADKIVDLGPGAGEAGGQIVYEGPGQGLLKTSSPTAEALRRRLQGPPLVRRQRRLPKGFLKIKRARAHNLKAIDVSIPLGAFACITGPSGSGKSSLLEFIIYRGLCRLKGQATEPPGAFEAIEGVDLINEVILIDQAPLGKTPRGNPATYLKIYGEIRRLLATSPEAKVRGFSASHFSFNSPLGRCPVCEGQGFERVEMQFLSDIFLPCPACQGQRFRPEILTVYYQGKNIAEILSLTIKEAANFFAGNPRIEPLLRGMISIGLGYLRLGQPLNTLSGGEAQRLKLARELFLRSDYGHLFLLDEPTVGLHLSDVDRLIRALEGLVEAGNTVWVIEHHLDLIAAADWIVELGPGAGEAGGYLVAEGPPEKIIQADCPTGRSLKGYLEKGLLFEAPKPPSLPPAPAGIEIQGARHHNLKNISLTVPRGKLVVFTGPSGSGKSTLAFDTIFVEGQRRYLECLSTYIRQFIPLHERPEVDLIRGLPPTVAIEQRTSRAGPRSTVGTLTEIYHYLRLLYARVADPFCPRCQRSLRAQSLEEMLVQILKGFSDREVSILAPKIKRRKGLHKPIFESAIQNRYRRIRVNGQILEIPPIPELNRYREHDIEVEVARMTAKEAAAGALRAALELALKEGSGEVFISDGQREITLSRHLYCPSCRLSLSEPDPLLFSFNTVSGACPACKGLGTGPRGTCPECKGSRLREEALAWRLAGINIAEVCRLPAEEALAWSKDLKFSGRRAKIAEPLLREIRSKLEFLCRVGLSYLELDRAGDSLSGGEAQRVRLAAELGSNLTGVCYVLDEPTIGLHPQDNALLIEALKDLRNRGNTVCVVEHDEETIRAADWIIDLGPGGGHKGGEIVAQGDLNTILQAPRSLTGRLLADVRRYRLSSRGRRGQDFLEIKGAWARNLKNIDVCLPLKGLICLTGPSGSGKSTLLLEVIYPSLKALLEGGRPVGCQDISGHKSISRVLKVDHSPIGRTPRSTPATYVGLMDDIRRLFAETKEARAKGFSPRRFSFNLAEGRCPHCQGQGRIRVEMRFLPEIYIPCEACNGTRYSPETLSVRYKGKTIAEVLSLTVEEAADFFAAVPSLAHKLKVLKELGLGYLTLGQASPSLSGGEAQRLKLAQEFVKRSSGGTLIILDEPTTGLHLADIAALMDLIHHLVDRGDTVIIIEHNLEVIKEADWIVDLGPSGGRKGGEVLFQGPPSELIYKETPTARFLRRYLRESQG
ncbi:excinuclease ABC subunit UvrA [Thermosulfuriphilus sp.]